MIDERGGVIAWPLEEAGVGQSGCEITRRVMVRIFLPIPEQPDTSPGRHEVHERVANRRYIPTEELELDAFGVSSQADPFAFLDPRAPRIRFAVGE